MKKFRKLRKNTNNYNRLKHDTQVVRFFGYTQDPMSESKIVVVKMRTSANFRKA